ncbi:Wzz/FepE/Etk N-terminal domain-containing protein [Nocardioides sp. BP30]|uniref:Wzz/FepE/Etk N-terminal domain-containing protein n=1 Tax=Nocardioides sp. BP30 TaxID=3036374 RepID=UPI00246966AE|nr:Wzz/FepE/Etk N-terminal domain-containing protein [Nocardioides sp. BP30]WGL51004.1 Wzz/FepE/Etk N-terminal domain-containing protein [Nocardioides sp. BP30]
MQTILTDKDVDRHQPAGDGVRGFFAVLWRRRLVAGLMLVVVAAAVAAVLALTPRQYTAAARVAATPPASLTQSPAGYDDLLGTLADVAHSRPVLEQVQRAVPSRSLAQLQREVRGSVVYGTVLIQVSVTDQDARLAAQIANAVAAALPAHDPGQGGLDLTTTQPATVPDSFASPDVPVVVLAGALLALALAVGAAFVYDRAARTVDTAEEVAEETGAGVLGVIARPTDAKGVPALEPGSREFPSLRALRVALEFASVHRPTRSLVVAPAATDPWAGWLEVNLAVTLAEVGHRVLLVDANRSAKHRHPVFDTTSLPGLYDILAGTVSLDGARLTGPVDGVTVVPLGNVDLAAPSLLEMRFGAFLDEIDEKYDVVLIHAAPVTESDDARIMAIGGGLVLTVPAGRVRPRVLATAVQLLRDVDTRVIGTVVHGARRTSRRSR